jgi:hypothetical protein
MIKTDQFILSYYKSPEKFSKNNLNITLNNMNGLVWYPGLTDYQNLNGTVHSLDQCKGPIELGNGILSRSGWSIIDDSNTPLIENSTKWITQKRTDTIDWIFFA